MTIKFLSIAIVMAFLLSHGIDMRELQQFGMTKISSDTTHGPGAAKMDLGSGFRSNLNLAIHHLEQHVRR
jgi:hypothetical protein